MIKVWGKIIKGEKVEKNAVIDVDSSKCTFFDMIKSVCEKLDCDTPVLLEKHLKDFSRFNFCVFKEEDFVEKIKFSKLIIQNITD